METEHKVEDLHTKYETLARQQMQLDDDWQLESMASAIRADLEEQIDQIDSDGELSDGERWRELDVNASPMAWLPKGMLLITMRKKTDDKITKKAGFIKTV